MQLEIPFYLGYDSKSFTVCYDAQAKINNFFYQLALLFNINVIFEWYLLRIMVFVVRRRVAENIEKKTKKIKILGIELYNKEYNCKIYHFSNFTKKFRLD